MCTAHPLISGTFCKRNNSYNVNRYNCSKMRHLFKLLILFIFLVSACNFPGAGQPAPDLTVVPETAPARSTDTPAQEVPYAECGFVWAREPLAELSREFDSALKAVQPQASGYAEAYGESCLNNQGEAVRFVAMETDFYVTLKVRDLEDKQILGEWIEQVLAAVSEFPVNETPGPQPGYVGITFETPSDELRMWFTQLEAQAAIDKGLQGEELFNSLQAE